MAFLKDDGPIFEADTVGDETEIITREEAERAFEEAKANADGFDIPPTYHIRVLSGRFRLAHSDAIAKRGDVLKVNQPGKLNPYGQPMTAHVDALPSDGNARLLVRRTGFDLILDPVAEFLSAQEGEGAADVPAASDGYTNYKDSQDLIGTGDITASLEPPGRADQIAIRAVSQDSNGFDVTFAFGNTDLTFGSDTSSVVDEVLPVYYLDDDIGLTVTDTSGGGSNTVDIDITVV